MDRPQLLYRKVLLQASESYDGETPVVLELEDQGHVLLLIFSSSEMAKVLGVYRPSARWKATEDAVYLAEDLKLCDRQSLLETECRQRPGLEFDTRPPMRRDLPL